MNNDNTYTMSLTGAMVVFTKFAVNKGLEVNLLADNSIQLVSLDKDVSFTIDIHSSGIQLYQGSIKAPRRVRIASTKVSFLNIVTCIEITDVIEKVMAEWDVLPSQFYFNALTDLVKNNVDVQYVTLDTDKTSVTITDTSSGAVLKFIDIMLVSEYNIVIMCMNGAEDTTRVEINNSLISYDDLGMYCNMVLAFIKKL